MKSHASTPSAPARAARTWGVGPGLFSVDPAAAGPEDASSLFTLTVAPKAGPPLHVHPHASETYYVLEGTFEFFVDGAFALRRAGGTAFIPAGTLHTFRNVGAAPGRLLVVAAPSGTTGHFDA